ncbi:hypothetical protein GCM10007047_17790 [Cerasicoccus arenae]|uniref:Glycoside hydrolase family 5 domain-containing protein n=1 Tax=Cerasicoccus arenae TaxID=424488 RepID=A0A8J3DJV7_9BACT|nr:hypothetical protein GCM10007047_17790 [Cerasicoccus arenae]
MRFWGVNSTSFYPEHSVADAYADNLAKCQINLLRPHHLFRQSLDWNPGMGSGAIVDYRNDSRTFDPVMLDRFDYLNAALQRNGIYLAMSVHFSRRYVPGDVKIIETDKADEAAWMSALSELNGWNWKKAIDVRKSLPVIDERAARLNEEFITKLMKHRNPYTGLTYAQSSQVLTLEVINESSLQYAITCGNRYPEYWQNKLEAKWANFATENGLSDPGDFYKPSTQKAKALRDRFLLELDEAYYQRIRNVVHETGSEVPMMFSNLWRGEGALAIQSEHSEVIENHAYIDPLVVRNAKDGLGDASLNALVDKPYFIGEFNQAEGERNIREQSPYRTMLMVAAAAYGNFQDWSGIVWFAWNHGTPAIAPDGKSVSEGRESSLGNMVADAMMTDHLRTAGLMFRRSMVAESSDPIALWIDEPYPGDNNYHKLMTGKFRVQSGWFNRHGIRRSFGPEPSGQASEPWFKESAGDVLVSDTGEIIKDTVRRQLTVTAQEAEAFSGFLDEAAPAGLSHLILDGEKDFATVILVANDNRPLSKSKSLLISRTAMNPEQQEIDGPKVILANMAQPSGGQWKFKVTRPSSISEAQSVALSADANGRLILPTDVWYEAELVLAK